METVNRQKIDEKRSDGKKPGITSSTIAKMGKNKAVSMEVLGKICIALDCNIGDIVDVIKEDYLK